MDDGSREPPVAGTLDYGRPSLPAPSRWVRVVEFTVCAGIVLLLVSILWPFGHGRRPQAAVIACAAHLRLVGHAIQVYANENGGAFPDTLDLLHPSHAKDARVFLCPTEPAGLPAARVADLTAGGHLSYVDAGGALTTATANKNVVVAFEWPGHHADMKVKGINVLFGDGRTEWVTDYRPILDRFAAGVRPVTSGAAAATTAPTTSPTVLPGP